MDGGSAANAGAMRGLPAAVLRVRHGLEELDSAAERHDAELNQRLVGCGAVPVLDAGRRVVDLSRPELLHRLAAPLHAGSALVDEQDETAVVAVPVGLVAGL